MQALRTYGISKTIAHLLFIVAPTIVFMYFLFFQLNLYYSILRDQYVQQTLYFAAGIVSATIFYAYRFRFSTTYALLILLLIAIGKVLSGSGSGEFDAFFISVQFRIFAIAFAVAWLVGWALLRKRFAAVLVASLLFVAMAFVVARSTTLQYSDFAMILALVAVYAAYIIYTSQALHHSNGTKAKHWILFTSRAILFSLFCATISFSTVYLLQDQLRSGFDNKKTSSQNDEGNFTKTDNNGNLDFKETMGLSGARKSDTALVLVAHIDYNYPGTELACPLYLTAYHYTKYDSFTQTFERDTAMLRKDEFEPNPSALGMLEIISDSTKILTNASFTSPRQTVETKIFNRKFSPALFVAPSTSYFMQTIPVDEQFREAYHTAYRTKSKVSQLNSALLVYSIQNPLIEQFQQERFALLRKAKSYKGLDSNFYKYYTSTPSTGEYAAIKRLADSLSKGKTTTIDKVLAVKDFFWSRDALGRRVFDYTENPGVPGVPSASRLNHFLFSTHKGYCAYYAGATAMLLRNMGIPCRIAAGMLTENRSNGKNDGWYWYYANQAHAWVEVYFPEYGWLDFDTTVDAVENREGNQADGTPPTSPEQASLGLNGIISAIDTSSKRISIKLTSLVAKDKTLTSSQEVQVNTAKAKFSHNSKQIGMAYLDKGDTVSAIYYDKRLDNLPSANAQLAIASIPQSTSADQVYVRKYKATQKHTAKPIATKKSIYKSLPFIVSYILALLFVLLLLLPKLLMWYYRLRLQLSSGNKQQAYYAKKAVMFYCRQYTVPKTEITDVQYARTIDDKYASALSPLTAAYQQLQYSNTAPKFDWKVQCKQIIQQLKKSSRKDRHWYNHINFIKTLLILRKP
ncbi:MAG: hypothetical protein RL660_3029 [Bacteroidota bacterium]|jgi:transglutaminase-like putative cysteine protease